MTKQAFNQPASHLERGPGPLLTGLLLWSVLLLTISCMTTHGEGNLAITDYKKNINFFVAVKDGNITGAEKISSGINVNARDQLGQTALMWACWNGEMQIINTLLNQRKTNTLLESRKNGDIPLSYNALFCYVMSNNITANNNFSLTPEQDSDPESYYKLISQLEEAAARKENPNSNALLYKLIVKNPKILTMTDAFNENVIHKIIRSNEVPYFYTVLAALNSAEYMELHNLAADLSKYENNPGKKEAALNKMASLKDRIKKKEQQLLEKKNQFGEWPLHLAIRFHNRQMVKLLLNKDVPTEDSALFDPGENTLFTFAFDGGRGDYGIFMELAAHRHKKTMEARDKGEPIKERDDAFAKYIKQFEEESREEHLKELAARYRRKYNEYESFLDNANKDAGSLLIDEEYNEQKRTLLALLRTRPISAHDIYQIDTILKRFPEFANEMDDSARKSILELAIENKNIAVFKTVFKHIRIDTLNPVGNSGGDYFTVALVNNNIEVMKYLLNEYQDNRYSINRYLWNNTSLYHRTDLEFFMGDNPLDDKLTDPLRIFLQKFKNEPLDGFVKEILSFYSPNFSNPNYDEHIIRSYLRLDINEAAFSHIFANFENEFAKVYLLRGQPLVEELIKPGANEEENKRRLAILKSYLKEIPHAAAVKDSDYDKIKQALSQRQDDPYTQEILDIVEKKLVELKPVNITTAANVSPSRNK